MKVTPYRPQHFPLSKVPLQVLLPAVSEWSLKGQPLSIQSPEAIPYRRSWWVAMSGFAMAFGLFAGFHLVLSDGHNQLQGQSKHVAKEVVEIFRNMGIEVAWSSDPGDLSSSTPYTVTVAILPHSSRAWRMADGVMAAVTRGGSDSRGSVFLFYPDVARAMDYHPARTSSIRNQRPPGVSWHVGVARVISHEILHYFLPGRSHDATGIFMEHQCGDLLLSAKLEVIPDAREALLKKLR
jgi:hypothetical protein